MFRLMKRAYGLAKFMIVMKIFEAISEAARNINLETLAIFAKEGIACIITQIL